MVNVGDHGSTIILAKSEEPTGQVLFSTDYGREFNSLMLFDDVEAEIQVLNIITEPSATTSSFILLGRNATSNLVISLDFSNVMPLCHIHDDMQAVKIDESCYFGQGVHKSHPGHIHAS